MARFELNKGERFTLKKSEGLENLTPTLPLTTNFNEFSRVAWT